MSVNTYERQGRRYFQYRGQRMELRGRHAEETVRAVLDKYRAGASVKAVAREHDVPCSTARSWCRRAGVNRSSREAAVNRLINEGKTSTVWLERTAEQLHREEHLSCREIAERLDEPRTRVQEALQRRAVLRDRREAGLVQRWGSMQAYAEFCRRAGRLYFPKGLSLRETADRLDCCVKTVRSALASDYCRYEYPPSTS